ncbi:MAG: Biopolymer transport protein ExbB [bacterium ADurb.Bin236]|nr:MAG: Biopolymer transport protein ExbB [bacterium ADurb.Bin236]HOY61933.1 MotA/TolQ/ExbB proton channel family protein [bacterium]HPN93998.1 MotA/TolQ/ExbB proton channel family protein [bacterium]
MSAIVDIMTKGGPVMWPLLLCSIVALAITIERFYSLSRAGADPEKLIGKVKDALKKKDYRVAVGYCEATPGPVAAALATAIDLHDLELEELKEGVNEAFLKEAPRMERGLPILSTLVTVAPLLGLLGTITGLMKLFSVIAGGHIGNSEQLSGGIAEALITTATGLTIAIIFMIFHNLLAARVDRIINQMEKSVTELVNFMRMEGRADVSN